MALSQFKAGDKARIVDEKGHYIKLGTIVTIERVGADGMVEVRGHCARWSRPQEANQSISYLQLEPIHCHCRYEVEWGQ